MPSLKATITILDGVYPSVKECTKALQSHMISLQKEENQGITRYIKCLETILTIPTISYNTQAQENQHLVTLKKLLNEIMLGKATKETTMELDNEGVVNVGQLRDLICKEHDKCDHHYAALEEKYKELKNDTSNKQKKHGTGGLYPAKELRHCLKEKEIGPRSPPKYKPKMTSFKHHVPWQTTQQLLQQTQKQFQQPKKSQHKQQWQNTRQHKQSASFLLTQISLETVQYSRQQNSIMKTIEAKLTQQFGFAANPKF